jgi:hypothetical protein
MNLIPIDQAAQMISPHMRARSASGKGLNNNFADGIRDAFPILSIKGKVFRVRVNGEEQALLDPNTRQPLPFLDVVLVNASPQLSKTYYAKGFVDGDLNPPDCWSLDSVTPDRSVANKMAPLCANCPMNAFGSRITDNGKQAKACQDARRVAVIMPHQLDGNEQMLMLLRVPQSSLKNLKVYAHMLERHQMEPGACITRLAFDYQEAFPKLLFNFVSPLNDQQYDKVIDIAEAPNTNLMLAAPDFEVAPSTGSLPNASGSMQGMAVQAPPVLQASPPPMMRGVMGESDPAPVIAPQGAIPVPQEAHKSTVITLPDGKLFDTTTGKYVEPQVKAEPVSLDPATIKLPDGKFFNTNSGAFVSGPERGAQPVQLEQGLVQPTTEAKAPTKKRAPAKKPTTSEPVEAQAEAPPEEQVDEETGEVTTVSQQTNVGVKPASRGLEDLLSILVPPST